jgi:hypothetical protein
MAVKKGISKNKLNELKFQRNQLNAMKSMVMSTQCSAALTYLAEKADDEGNVDISQGMFGKKTGRARDTARRHMDTLVAGGYIIRADGKNTGNKIPRYRVQDVSYWKTIAKSKPATTAATAEKSIKRQIRELTYMSSSMKKVYEYLKSIAKDHVAVPKKGHEAIGMDKIVFYSGITSLIGTRLITRIGTGKYLVGGQPAPSTEIDALTILAFIASDMGRDGTFVLRSDRLKGAVSAAKHNFTDKIAILKAGGYIVPLGNGRYKMNELGDEDAAAAYIAGYLTARGVLSGLWDAADNEGVAFCTTANLLYRGDAVTSETINRALRMLAAGNFAHSFGSGNSRKFYVNKPLAEKVLKACNAGFIGAESAVSPGRRNGGNRGRDTRRPVAGIADVRKGPEIEVAAPAKTQADPFDTNEQDWLMNTLVGDCAFCSHGPVCGNKENMPLCWDFKGFPHFVPVGELEGGVRFSYGGSEWISLGPDGEGVSALFAGSIPTEFDVGGSNNFGESSLSTWLNDEKSGFAAMLAKGGASFSDLIPIEDRLDADDGTDGYVPFKGLVSLLSQEEYRRRRRFLPDNKTPFWLSNPRSCKANNNQVRIVEAEGTVFHTVASEKHGAKPIIRLAKHVTVGV